jgi:hypothetical protein
MDEVSLDDFEGAASEGGRVFLKTCNTESAGMGVYIASSPRRLRGSAPPSAKIRRASA